MRSTERVGVRKVMLPCPISTIPRYIAGSPIPIEIPPISSGRIAASGARNNKPTTISETTIPGPMPIPRAGWNVFWISFMRTGLPVT